MKILTFITSSILRGRSYWKNTTLIPPIFFRISLLLKKIYMISQKIFNNSPIYSPRTLFLLNFIAFCMRYIRWFCKENLIISKSSQTIFQNKSFFWHIKFNILFLVFPTLRWFICICSDYLLIYWIYFTLFLPLLPPLLPLLFLLHSFIKSFSSFYPESTFPSGNLFFSLGRSFFPSNLFCFFSFST